MHDLYHSAIAVYGQQPANGFGWNRGHYLLFDYSENWNLQIRDFKPELCIPTALAKNCGLPADVSKPVQSMYVRSRLGRDDVRVENCGADNLPEDIPANSVVGERHDRIRERDEIQVVRFVRVAGCFLAGAEHRP